MALFFFDSFQSSDIPDGVFFFTYHHFSCLFSSTFCSVCQLESWHCKDGFPQCGISSDMSKIVSFKNCQTAHTMRFLPTGAEHMSIIVLIATPRPDNQTAQGSKFDCQPVILHLILDKQHHKSCLLKGINVPLIKSFEDNPSILTHFSVE